MQGTWQVFLPGVALEGGVEGITKDHHSWVQGEDLAVLYEKYDHPLYKRSNKTAEGSGHGGMDGNYGIQNSRVPAKRTSSRPKRL